MVNTKQYASYIPDALVDMSWVDSYEDGNVSGKFDDAHSTDHENGHSHKK